MTKKILVIYASQYGATKEIAEKIGEVLQQEGVQTNVLSVDSIRDITPYQAVILGSGVYINQWNKKAVTFLQTHEKALADRQVWLFSSGPTGVGDPVKLIGGWQLPAALKPVANCIKPRDITVFHGYINPARLNFIQKWVIKNIVKKPFGDYRNWDSIVDWTNSVATELKLAS